MNQRLDVYRRISNIRNTDDASDVVDELIDRFGDPPRAVKGLIDIALIRTGAACIGIYEVKQIKGFLNLYMKKIDMSQISKIMKNIKNKVLVNASSRPYISIKIEESEDPIDILQKVIK